MKIAIKKLNENAILPAFGSELAAGADLYACIKEAVNIEPGQTQFIQTGIAMAIPQGYAGLIMARSGLSCKQGLAPANKVGLIDADYRGEVVVALHNHGKLAKVIHPEDRIAQLVITPIPEIEYEEVESLDETDRGADGFGSTGK